ncbi:MAG TPA: chemotaxis protein CheB, partial [Verrucomicrobiota bacterium]|nr:chemotaxis protein CheB [Verrucomicrobiota bacterium]
MRKPKAPQRNKPASLKAAHAVPAGRRDTNVARARFPIVGIGSSAGGLEALEQFLGHVQAQSGMAFVIVQHLDPTRKGGMAELLQRATKMKVVQVKDRTPVKPDCVYVIPPNKNMSIFHSVLHLFEPDTPRGLRLPIDYFFRALADDQQERSIGVVLSGMGSDGTLGLRAIKERGGLVVVQDPVTAKFDGMPHSAVETGLADIVAPVTELADRIKAYLEHAPTGMATRMLFEGKAKSSLDKVVLLLRSQTGHDFSLYKKSTLYRRVERRMAIHQVDRIATYVRYLQENPAEVERLFKELLISVTSFFRDAAAWTQLRDEVLPCLLTDRTAGQPLRVWVPGCSTGEEAYSIAMVCKEAIERFKPRMNVALQVFATDLDREAIDRARQGFFPANIVADVESERLARFFTKEEGGYRVNKDVRETIIFAVQNLIMDPPFTRLDLLSCRNLLIYLEQELQKRLLPLFHYSLAPGGFLFLGSAESTGGFTDLFAPLTNKSRFFRRNETPARAEAVEFPITFPGGAGPSAEPNRTARTPLNLQTLCDQALLSRFAPAAVLTNEKGDILYISGRTGKFLEPAMGRANWNILAMAREGLRYDLMIALHKAACQRGPVAVHAVHVRTNGSEEQVDLVVEALEEPAALRGNILVMFKQSVATPEPASRGKAHPDPGPRPAHLEMELQQLREELQTTREEMQTSQEELRSANEELQSTNEELQSTNEELTTSKEEMQSLNEELQTVNAELQGKVDDLSRANSDMRNLLDSTDIATVFLDRDLNVRRFTSEATKLFKLIAT